MNSKVKMEHAEAIAKQLDSGRTLDLIKRDLNEKGGNETDIESILFLARQILSNQYLPKIIDYLKSEEDFNNSEEFKTIDGQTLELMIKQGLEELSVRERRKITELLKKGVPKKEVLKAVDTRFYSLENAKIQLHNVHESMTENSTSVRIANILLGVFILAVTGFIALTIGRVFYILPIIGAVFIYRGFTKKRIQYED